MKSSSSESGGGEEKRELDRFTSVLQDASMVSSGDGDADDIRITVQKQIRFSSRRIQKKKSSIESSLFPWPFPFSKKREKASKSRLGTPKKMKKTKNSGVVDNFKRKKKPVPKRNLSQ